MANNEGVADNTRMQKFYASATYWAIPTNPPDCGLPGWKFIPTVELQPNHYVLSGNNKSEKSVNTDHVCMSH